MVERKNTERPVRLSSTPQVSRGSTQGASVGNAAGAFSTHVASAPSIIRNDHRDGVGSALALHVIKRLSGTLDDIISAKQQQAYLDGALAVNAGKDEEELETSILTKNWTIAGHRDYTARLAAAEYESNLVKDLERDRELTPAQYKDKLSSARSSIMPTIQGMSAQGREKMLDQLLTTEMAAQKNHLRAYQEHIKSMKLATVQSELSVGVDKVLAARSDPELHQQELVSFTTKLYRNVLEGEDLTYGDKVGVIENILNYTLAEGDFSVLRAMEQLPMPGTNPEDGVTVMNALPMDSRLKISKAKATAESKYFMNAEPAYWSKYQQFKAEQEAGLPTTSNARDLIQEVVALGHAGKMSTSNVESHINYYNKAEVNNVNKAVGLSAYASGDVAGLLQAGLTDKQGFDAYLEARAKTGISNVELFMDVYNLHSNNRSPAAKKWLGETLNRGITIWLTTPEAELSENELAQQYVDLVTAYAAAKPSTNELRALHNNVSAELEKDAADFMYTTLTQVGKGTPPDQAARIAKDRYVKWQDMSPSTKNAVISERNAIKQEALESISTTRNWYSTELLAGLMSRTGSSEYQLAVRNKWFVDQDMVQQTWRNEVLGRVDYYMSDYLDAGLGFDADSLKSYAVQKASQDVISTRFGSVMKPINMDVDEAFGIPAGYDGSELVEKAIGNAIQQETDHRKWERKNIDYRLTMDTDGIIVQSYSKTTQEWVGSVVVTNEQIRENVQELVKRDDRHAANHVNNSFEVKGSNGGKINIGGINTAGMSTEHNLNVKSSIVRFEGVVHTVSPDPGDGKPTIGPGLHVGNPLVRRLYKEYTGKVMKMGDTVDPTVVDHIFQEVSDVMFKEARDNHMVPLPNKWEHNRDAYEELIIHMHWQTGSPRLNKDQAFQEMQQFIQGGPQYRQQALQALKNTYAYAGAGADRVRYYESLLNQIRS